MWSFLLDNRSKFSAMVFMLMLSLPLAGHMFLSKNSGDVSQLENRSLASMPTIETLRSDWRNYTNALNNWMEDRVGFRNEFVALHGRLRDGFELERSEQAVIGDDGWYFSTLSGALKMHQGRLPFAGRQAEAWLEAAADIQEIVQNRGAEFSVFVTPNKHSVYPEKLSKYPVQPGAPRRAQVLSARAPEFRVDMIYPITDFLEAKAQWQVFYQTDTHWSEAGAFIGYQAFVRMATEAGLAVDALDIERDIQISEPVPFRGDIYGLLAISDGEPEFISEWRVRAPREVEESELPEFDAFGVKAIFKNATDGNGPRLLLFGDSFAVGMLPYLQESFSEITYVYHGWINPRLDALDLRAYDLVVLQVTERALSSPLTLELP